MNLQQRMPAAARHPRAMPVPTPAPAPALATSPKPRHDFASLASAVRAAGLLDKRPGWYIWRASATLTAIAACVTAIVLVPSLPALVGISVILGFALGQATMLGHDAGHGQIARSSIRNAVVGFANNVLVGGSWSWWVQSHDRHHGKPNQLGLDPAVNFDVIAMTREQALEKKGFVRFMVKYQAFFIAPLMAFYTLSLRIDSFHHLRTAARRPWMEAGLIAAHAILWLGALGAVIGFWHAALVLLVSQAAFGLYVASVFLPNHHGMPVVAAEERPDFVHHQVVTARNVTGGLFTDFWFGGLNFQIEHHLFPQAPRANLRAISRYVRPFCEERGIPYHEAGWRQSYREVFSYLHEMSAPLR